MKNFTTTLLTALLTLLSFFAVAQNGEFDVRFNYHKVDCNLNKIFVDIEIRASSSSTEFFLSDQNYRFSYNRDAVVLGSIAIDTMMLTGFIGSSLYEPHNLTGTLDTVVSYNVVLAGGDGEMMTTTWRTVGRISLDILDINKCLNLIWHDHSPAMFPPTFIGEKVGLLLYEVPENLYLNNTTCPLPICIALPIELTSFEASEEDCSIVLDWTTASEENNDYFQVEKSTDGETFEVISTIDGAGTSNQLKHYTFTDSKAVAINYYRLKQVDFDGTSTTSKTITMRSSCFEEGTAFTMSEIYPNPVSSGSVNIRFYTEIEINEATILITDVVGRTVHTETTDVVLGQNKLTFSSDLLTSGTYLVRIKNDDFRTKAKKFIKVNN